MSNLKLILTTEELRRQTLDECLEQLSEIHMMLNDLKRLSTKKTGPNSGRKFTQAHKNKIARSLRAYNKAIASSIRAYNKAKKK